jgi:hypothetical protein
MEQQKKATKGHGKAPPCFVIGPIGEEGSPERRHSDLLLNAVIKQVLQHSDLGYIVKRADEDADPGMIGDRVVTDIIHADLVVADLTDLNPNAFTSSESGIRLRDRQSTLRELERCSHSIMSRIARFSWI